MYDLTVEKQHCYLANGLLVSNSDCYRYIALCAEQMTNEDEGSMAAVARYEALDPEMGY